MVRLPSWFMWAPIVLLALIPCIAVGFGVALSYPVVRIHAAYVPTECTILAKEVQVRRRVGRDTGRTSRPSFRFSYLAPESATPGAPTRTHLASGYDGVGVYTNLMDPKTTLAAYDIGKVYPCWYDPAAPAQAVLVKPSFVHLLWLPGSLAFVVAFGGMARSLHRRWREHL